MYHQLGVVFLPDFSKSGYDLLNLDTLIVKHTDIRNYCGLVLYPRRYIRKQIREDRLNYIYIGSQWSTQLYSAIIISGGNYFGTTISLMCSLLFG